MKITGELLKAERLKQGLSVSEVASSLKLSSRIINAIENANIEDLPAKTFIRGFVKSYAQFLKLDADLILRQFQEEMGSTQPLPKTPPPQAVNTENKPQRVKPTASQLNPTDIDLNLESKRKTLIYVSIASGLLIIILVINNIVEKYQKESVVDNKGIESVQPLNQPANPAAAPSAIATAPSDQTTGVLQNTPTASSENQPASAASVPSSVMPNSINEKAAPDLSVTTSAPPDFEPSNGKPVELIVIAKKDAEFEYAKGNTKAFTRVKLSPKQVQVIRSSSGLHLKSEDGSGLNLILNGIEKGQASASNKPVRLTF